MIVPGSRALLAAALVVLPVATLAGIMPGLALPCAGILAVCFAASVVDAMAGRQRVAAFGARAPEMVRLTKDVRADVTITLENRSARVLSLRAGLAMPEGVASERLTESVTLQPGRSTLAWPCTGTTRGDHALRDLHVETPSPLGLWRARACRWSATCASIRTCAIAPPRRYFCARRMPACACIGKWVRAGSSSGCASTYRAIAMKISIGRRRLTGAVRW